MENVDLVYFSVARKQRNKALAHFPVRLKSLFLDVHVFENSYWQSVQNIY
jgi:hypothetical protein